MSRVFSILLIGVGGYYLFQNRYKLMNNIFAKPLIRKFLVSSIMKIPGIRNKMMGTLFSSQPNLS
ncbi:hypothetical protein [Bacillus massilinigeriensis]|uniref:hypothetical protein n=1 Tax=Bacillus massilionigeriensis TaxID=1805475 RepID=UPI00096B2528|nr:hypothetical protein [Bacillus massilionigeriensis]